jgi:hypothetical protein
MLRHPPVRFALRGTVDRNDGKANAVAVIKKGHLRRASQVGKAARQTVNVLVFSRPMAGMRLLSRVRKLS